MRRTGYLAVLIMLVIMTQGCGETIRGIGRDVGRVGRGIKTIFVSDYR